MEDIPTIRVDLGYEDPRGMAYARGKGPSHIVHTITEALLRGENEKPVSGIRVLRSKAKTPLRYVDLVYEWKVVLGRNSSLLGKCVYYPTKKAIRFRLKKDDSYLLGFQVELPGAPWWEFKPESGPGEIAGSRKLSYNGSYTRRGMGGDRTTILENLNHLYTFGCTDRVVTANDMKECAVPLLFMIQFSCENVRLTQGCETANQQWRLTRPPNLAPGEDTGVKYAQPVGEVLRDLQNDWEDMSEDLQNPELLRDNSKEAKAKREKSKQELALAKCWVPRRPR